MILEIICVFFIGEIRSAPTGGDIVDDIATSDELMRVGYAFTLHHLRKIEN